MPNDIVHGHSRKKHRTPEYSVWASMKARCTRPHHPMWAGYGGRGITVCNRWMSFSNFIADMGLRPSSRHSIDRIDNNLGYCPENCRWATFGTQSRNKRSNVVVEFDGRSQCLMDWAIEFSIDFGVLRWRILKGWDIASALHTPVKHRPQKKMITHNGETLSISEWCKRTGLRRETIRERLKRGLSTEAALLPLNNKL